MKLVNEHLKQLNITTIGSNVYGLVVTLCVNDNNSTVITHVVYYSHRQEYLLSP